MSDTDWITIADDVYLFTDGSTAKIKNETFTIDLNATEVLGIMGSLRFALGLNADEFQVADTEEGPAITLDRVGMKELLDTLESIRAAQDFDDEERWDF